MISNVELNKIYILNGKGAKQKALKQQVAIYSSGYKGK